MSHALPKEMQPHTYAIMREVEDKHWWYVGRRRIIESFVQRICNDIRSEGAAGVRILDIGCGTGGNLESLSKFGEAEGVDISREALDFCRARGLKNVSGRLTSRGYYPERVGRLSDLLGFRGHVREDIQRQIHRTSQAISTSLKNPDLVVEPLDKT